MGAVKLNWGTAFFRMHFFSHLNGKMFEIKSSSLNGMKLNLKVKSKLATRFFDEIIKSRVI